MILPCDDIRAHSDPVLVVVSMIGEDADRLASLYGSANLEEMKKLLIEGALPTISSTYRTMKGSLCFFFGGCWDERPSQRCRVL